MPLSVLDALGNPSSLQIAADFRAQDEVSLAFAPTLKYFLNLNNPLIHAKFNVKGLFLKRTDLQSDGIAVQPSSGNCVWNPGGGMSSVQSKIPVEKYAIQDEICYDEAEETCLELLGGTQLETGNLNETELGRALMNAYAMLKTKDVHQNILEVFWFGNKRYKKTDFANANPRHVKAADLDRWKDRAYSLMTKGNGLIADMQFRTASDGVTKMEISLSNGDPFLDAYRGVDLPANYAQDVIFPTLKEGDSDRLLTNVVMDDAILVTRSVYRNYYKTLSDNGSLAGIEAAWRMQQTGSQLTRSSAMDLTWQGITVIYCPELDVIANKYFGIKKFHMATYTINGNLGFGTDIQSVSGNGSVEPFLQIRRGAEITTEDILYFKGRYKQGQGVEYPEYCNYVTSQRFGA